MKCKSGIYIISFKNNGGKIYIGSTTDFKDRKRRHLDSLKNQHHINRHLQNAFNKYGKQNFKFEIIKRIPSNDNETKKEFGKRLAEVHEQHYLDTLLFAQEFIKSNGQDKRFYELGYNLSPTASTNKGYKWTEKQREAHKINMEGFIPWNKGLKLGPQTKKLIRLRVKNRKPYKHSEETRRKISESNMGKKMPTPSLELRTRRGLAIRGKNFKSVKQYDANRKLVAVYSSLDQVRDIFHCNRGKLSQAIKLKLVFKGFRWKFNSKVKGVKYELFIENPKLFPRDRWGYK